jgi:hypothetical protein
MVNNVIGLRARIGGEGGEPRARRAGRVRKIRKRTGYNRIQPEGRLRRKRRDKMVKGLQY